tara:strand:- start:14 stop:583 length:570 start_codon:yes stop_codon:yes gene_type:complete
VAQSSSLVGSLSGFVLLSLALENGLSIIEGICVVVVGGIETSVVTAGDIGKSAVHSLLRSFLESIDDSVLLIGIGSNENNLTSSLLGNVVNGGMSKWVSSSEIENAICSIFESERVGSGVEVHKEWHDWDYEAQITTLGTSAALEVDRSISDRAVLLEFTTNNDWHIVGDWGSDLNAGCVAVKEEALES